MSNLWGWSLVAARDGAGVGSSGWLEKSPEQPETLARRCAAIVVRRRGMPEAATDLYVTAWLAAYRHESGRVGECEGGETIHGTRTRAGATH